MTKITLKVEFEVEVESGNPDIDPQEITYNLKLVLIKGAPADTKIIRHEMMDSDVLEMSGP